MLTGFTHFDYKEQEYRPKYLKDYLYCHKRLGEGVLPRCPILEYTYNDISTDIFFPPDFPKSKQSQSHSEHKSGVIGQLISYLEYWINEKIEPGENQDNPIFGFYAYSRNPCTRRLSFIDIAFNDLITNLNFNKQEAISEELKRLRDNLYKEAKEWDEYNDSKKQWQQWIDPSDSNPVLVKEAAAALLYKLQHIGSMVREEIAEPEPQGKAGPGETVRPGYEASQLHKVPVSKLIKQGESQTLEFKETLEHDTQNKGKEKDILLSSLKTIAGFLNTVGGTLLIGVDDSGRPRGIERDLSMMKHANNDRFEQKIRNCLKDRFNPHPIGKVNISFRKLSGATICRVDIQASEDVTRLDGRVYVRDGNATLWLEGPTLTGWIEKRKTRH